MRTSLPKHDPSEGKEEKHINKRPWLPEEDSLILSLVQKYGPNWVRVSNQVAGRTGKQCRERYYNHLQENIKKGDWSPEEDQKILRLQARFGNHWVVIMKELPGRTDNAVKNRFHALKRAKAQIVEDPTDIAAIVSSSRLYKKSAGKTVSSNNPSSAPIPPTPTSVTSIVTPKSCVPSRFTWRGVSVETLPEETEESCLGVQTQLQDIESMLDCLSPIITGSAVAQEPLRLGYESGPITNLPPVVVEDQDETSDVNDFSSLMDLTDEEWGNLSGNEADDEQENANECGNRAITTDTPSINSLSGAPIRSLAGTSASAGDTFDEDFESSTDSIDTGDCKLTDDEKEEFFRLLGGNDGEEFPSSSCLPAPVNMVIDVDETDLYHHVRENSGQHTCYPIVLDTPDLSSSLRNSSAFSAAPSPVHKKLRTHGCTPTFAQPLNGFSAGLLA